MKLDAYLNYDSRRANTPDPRDRAYLAPINTPDYQSLGLEDGPLQHDIFEHHSEAPYMGSVDLTRQSSQRQGM